MSPSSRHVRIWNPDSALARAQRLPGRQREGLRPTAPDLNRRTPGKACRTVRADFRDMSISCV